MSSPPRLSTRDRTILSVLLAASAIGTAALIEQAFPPGTARSFLQILQAVLACAGIVLLFFGDPKIARLGIPAGIKQAFRWTNIGTYYRAHPGPTRRAAASATILILTLAMLARTTWIGTNDLFHFGQGNRWWCYVIVNYWYVSASVETYSPSGPKHTRGPAQHAAGWFYFHVKARGGIWALTWRDTNTSSHVDLILFGKHDTLVSGIYAGSVYWITLDHIFPILTVASALHFSLWARRYTRSLQTPGCLCPTCSYDLRAHAPGGTCPECGAPIPAKPAR